MTVAPIRHPRSYLGAWPTTSVQMQNVLRINRRECLPPHRYGLDEMPCLWGDDGPCPTCRTVAEMKGEHP